MLYCLMCQDKENAIETRMQNREDHLKYVAETNVVKYAGPLLSEEGQIWSRCQAADLGSHREPVRLPEAAPVGADIGSQGARAGTARPQTRWQVPEK